MHWTYAPLVRSTDIEQGDILVPTPELRSILKDVHPHFLDEKYLAFLVTTQSCDLVVRGSDCKAPHIAIAAIRRLGSVFPRVLEQMADQLAPGVYPTDTKVEARRLLERILNQNEAALGMFYLYPDADSGIADHAVAMLRVTVTLRREHYETLRTATRGRLDPEFRNKLGWLLGNLYARPAAPDWHDKGQAEEQDRLIALFLENPANVVWLPRTQFENARKSGVAVEAIPRGDLLARTAEFAPKPQLELALDAVGQELARITELDPSVRTKITNRLRNSGRFHKALSSRTE